MKKNFIYILLIAFSLQLAFLPGCATVPKVAPHAISPALQDQIVKINNVDYVPLIIVCDRFDYKWSWDTVARKAGIQNKNNYFRFSEGSRFALTGDKVVNMGFPAVIYRGALMVPVSFAQEKIAVQQDTVCHPVYSVKKDYLLRKVVVDAGHGGKDPGAIGRCGLLEKDVALDIAIRLADKLKKEGFDVYLTRSSDRFIALSKRVQIANDKSADFFVSIHVNAAKMKNVKGFEVYYLSEAADDAARKLAESENASLKFEEGSYQVNSSNNLQCILWDLVSTENRTESIQLAGHISDQARKRLWVRQRGVKSAGFYVLKGARMPAILVETGFITNLDEEAKLKRPDYRDAIADAIAKGILDYRQEYEKTEGFAR